MEGNEIQLGLNSFLSLIQILIMTTSSETVSSLCSDPLFSCIITLYTLILIFYPYALKIFLSPVLILTTLLLLFLLRLGASQRLQIPAETEQNSTAEDKNRDSNENCRSLAQIDKWVESQAELRFQSCPPEQNFEHSFVEWNVRAPLEVIYETYEGDEDDQDCEFYNPQVQSLSMYYPETDSDSSSDGGFLTNGGWDSPESVYLKWEEEDKEGMLIEIALDSNGKQHPSMTGFQFEEDNLIEIDISPRRKRQF